MQVQNEIGLCGKMGKARKNKNTRGGGRECVMQPSDFKRWRKSLQLSQKQAAEALGLRRRVVQYYEKGVRDGAPVEIPKAIRLACFALSATRGNLARIEVRQIDGRPNVRES
jgi:DNA-binding transcriptional regulator YiaG